MRPDSEETQTNDAKVSDSGYSNSCSNSQSQRSSGSSKSRHSSSSGGSSGYCGGSLSNINEVGGSSSAGKRKDKEHKKKKVKTVQSSTTAPPTVQPDSLADGNNNSQAHNASNLQQPLSSAPEDTSVRTPGADNEALQIASLSQTLSCIKKLKYSEKSDDGMDLGSPPKSIEEPHNQEQIMNCLKTDSNHDEEMKIVVSMGDGVVVYTTPSLTPVLGYPKDMWVGRSFIDFVHPKHRTAFAAHITSVIADLDQSSPGGIANTKKNSFFCCLRQYRGLRSSGFNVIEKRVLYVPCQLFMAFKEVVETKPQGIYLVITAIPVQPAYKYPDETRMSPKFMTRHSASCQLCHVDPEATPYFGYLPQDLLGRSVLEFYHPEDLHFLKEVYEAVMKEQGHPFRSKPYRFRCQNGGYALLETEMSSYINPWSRKLEFIIGQHSVLRGPPNPDVMTPLNECEPLQVSEETLKESKIVQEEIKCLLNETVIRSSETAKQQVSKRCKDLATFMENLMDELTKPPDLKIDVPTEEQSFSERDSVMLGEISPHHEYYDSKSSSETPPSYNQLNYNENIQRFFDSKPKTTLSDSDDRKNLGTEEGKISPPVDSSNTSNRPCCFANDSGASGDSSGLSTESNGNNSRETTTTSNESQASAKLPTLTEQILSRHNEDMEKKMVQKHRELRSKSERDSKCKDRHKNGYDKILEEGTSQGIKRSGSHSWEGEPYKAIKATHMGQEENSGLALPPQSISAPMANPDGANPPSPPNLWPPFSVSVPSLHTPRPEYPGTPFASPLLPMYYLNPRPEGSNSYQHPAYFSQQLPFMPGMMYQPMAMPMFGAPPMVYSPLTMLHHGSNHYPTPQGPSPADNSNTQAIKGDQKGQPLSAQADNIKSDGDSNETSANYDDSSYHSSFYSFLKTDKSDESMKSSSENDNKNQNNWRKERGINNKVKPIRKVAPWVEDISVTPEFVLKYQLRERTLEDVLRSDFELLEKINQPSLVNDQLTQMYTDLELEGLSKQLTLEEGITSSSESSGEEKGTSNSSQNSECKGRRKKRYMEYDKMVILFEEDAPFPPPIPV